MSAENCDAPLSVSLRNVLNSIQCIRDRVRDGESNESDGAFNLSNFWDTLNQAVKAVSQEATKLSLAFSRPPLPSVQDGEKLSESILKSVLTLSAVYYWLPKSQGVTLRRQVRDATVEVLEGVLQLLEVILRSPLHRCTHHYHTNTGGEITQQCNLLDFGSCLLNIFTGFTMHISLNIAQPSSPADWKKFHPYLHHSCLLLTHKHSSCRNI
ncbi:Cyclin-D1-binding protein 1 [Xenotaenia resolanae]|uniref:Cyclin-D1-binding protein 1 n=1 Tax=Xenotaenia resolanae TaxID=208358 RepID=A0ABV0WK63_9TELE